MTSIEQKLLNHYKCFQTELLWVDEHNEEIGFLSIQHHTFNVPSFYLCRNIAKYCKKHLDNEKYRYIYVSAYAFKADDLLMKKPLATPTKTKQATN